jgi:hypothetical protein
LIPFGHLRPFSGAIAGNSTPSFEPKILREH